MIVNGNYSKAPKTPIIIKLINISKLNKKYIHNK